MKIQSILYEADDIVNRRGQEKERNYGNFEDTMLLAAEIASSCTWLKITSKDMYLIMVAMKLAREKHFHRRDNLLDACAYLWGLDNHYN